MKRLIIFLCSIIFSVGLSAQTSFQEKIIKLNFSGPAGLHAGDIDLDGDIDLLAASGEFGVFLFENKNHGAEWETHTIDTYLGVCLSVWMDDLDGDGDQDILAGGWDSNQIVWYQNLQDQGLWQKKIIKSNYGSPHEVRTEDFDGDGDPDIMVAGATANQTSVFFNTQGDASQWTEQTVANNFMGARSVDAADLDQDGDIDLVGASLTGNEVTVWRNDGGNPIVWSAVDISTQFNGSHRVQLIDMDQDGWKDIVGTAYSISTICWWKNPGLIDATWELFLVDDDLTGAVIGTACDFDSDGDMDIVGTAQPSNTVIYYERLDNGVNEWRKTVIDDQFGGAWPLAIGDFNGDGNPDFAVGGNSANKVAWYQIVQQGRFNRLIQIGDQESKTGLFVPPGSGESVPLLLALPYCGDDFAYSRLRDMIIPVAESRGCLIMVPSIISTQADIDELINYAVNHLAADPDSVYLAGLACSGELTLEYAINRADAILGVIPFNPALSSQMVHDSGSFPDVPVFLSSGTSHPDRQNHERVIESINGLYGKAFLDNMNGVGEDVLVFDLTQRLINAMDYIDTIQGSTSSAKTETQLFDLQVYPNPVGHELSIQLSQCEAESRVELIDSQGKQVWSRSMVVNGRLSIPVNRLGIAPGLYYLVYSDHKRRMTRSIIINGQ